MTPCTACGTPRPPGALLLVTDARTSSTFVLCRPTVSEAQKQRTCLWRAGIRLAKTIELLDPRAARSYDHEAAA